MLVFRLAKGTIGNIIGPLTFTGATYPTYTPAKIAIMATGAFAIAATFLLMWKYNYENKRRDKIAIETPEGGQHVEDSEFMDFTDRQNLEFRYCL